MDIKSRQQEAGAYFRAVRQGLGLSLRDVAVPPLSYSQLSRFERGDSDISTGEAVQLMAALGMAKTDIRLMQQASGYTFPANLIDSVMFGDDEYIVQQVQRYTTAHVDDPVTTMQDIERILLTCAQKDIASDYQIGIVDERIMTTFLMYPESWKMVELTAVGLCAPFTSQEFRTRCWKRLNRYDIEHGSIEVSLQVMECLLLSAVKFGDWETFNRELRLLLRYSEDDNWHRYIRNTKIVVEFIKLIGQSQNVDSALLNDQVDWLLKMTTEVGGELVVPYLKQHLQFVRQPLKPVHHALVFNEEQSTKPPSDAVGAYLAEVRVQRHLRQNQVSLAWSPSAQTRFEKGENQFGFVRTDVLKEFLLTDWVDIGGTAFTACDRCFAAISALARKDNLNQKTAAPVLAKLHEELVQMPAKTAEVQELAAKLYSYARAFDDVPRELIARGVELLQRSKQWTYRTYMLFAACSGNAVPGDAFILWRSLVGADNGYTPHIKDTGTLDFYVALSISGYGDKKIARKMLAELPYVHMPKKICLQTFYVPLARMLCEWTIDPSKENEAKIERRLRTLMALGYKREVEDQLPNFFYRIKSPEFMAEYDHDVS